MATTIKRPAPLRPDIKLLTSQVAQHRRDFPLVSMSDGVSAMLEQWKKAHNVDLSDVEFAYYRAAIIRESNLRAESVRKSKRIKANRAERQYRAFTDHEAPIPPERFAPVLGRTPQKFKRRSD